MDEEARKAKQAEYYRTYYLRHRERLKERSRQWRAEHPEEVREQSRRAYEAKLKKGYPTGAQHHNWRGEDVSYGALHTWIVRVKGRPQRCDVCGTTEPKMYDWANVDHKYRRELSDWVRMCRSCHRRHDYSKGLSEKGGRWPRRAPP